MADPVQAATSVHEYLPVHLVAASVGSVHAARVPESPTSSTLHLPLPLHQFLTPPPNLLQHRQHRLVPDSDDNDDDDDNGRADGAGLAAIPAEIPSYPSPPPTPPLPRAGLGHSLPPAPEEAASEAVAPAEATIETAAAAAAAKAAEAEAEAKAGAAESGDGRGVRRRVRPRRPGATRLPLSRHPPPLTGAARLPLPPPRPLAGARGDPDGGGAREA